MRPPAIGHSAWITVGRRWRGMSRRRRVMLGLFAAVGLLGAAWWSLRVMDWPARVVLQAPGDALPLAFSPDGATIVTRNSEGLTLWETAGGRKRATWSIPGG